jgi:hypothetical protein
MWGPLSPVSQPSRQAQLSVSRQQQQPMQMEICRVSAPTGSHKGSSLVSRNTNTLVAVDGATETSSLASPMQDILVPFVTKRSSSPQLAEEVAPIPVSEESKTKSGKQVVDKTSDHSRQDELGVVARMVCAIHVIMLWHRRLLNSRNVLIPSIVWTLCVVLSCV